MISRFFTGKRVSKMGRESEAPPYANQYLDMAVLTTPPSILNVLAIKVFGEAEFWLSGGKA